MFSKTIFALICENNLAPARVVNIYGFHKVGDAEAFGIAGLAITIWTYLKTFEY